PGSATMYEKAVKKTEEGAMNAKAVVKKKKKGSASRRFDFSREKLKYAVILREILEKPVSLKRK
ncbi:MAG: hypothetical protein ACLFQK_11160, partial [Fibrobacterota bacterium]